VEEIKTRIKSALRGMRSSRIKLQPVAQQPAAKVINTKPEVIRTRVSDKHKGTPRPKKREDAAVNPVVKKRPQKTITKAEAAYRAKLKTLQEELKSVKKELMEISRTEKTLAKEVEKNQAELNRLAREEARLK